MTGREFARMLDGREYGYPQFTKEEIEIAKDNGLVIVCGASDDLMEFYGAICDEGGCFEGGVVYFNQDGVIYRENDVEPEKCSKITALWCEGEDESGKLATWTYETDIPCETFKIWEDSELYCIGIVFSLEDVEP